MPPEAKPELQAVLWDLDGTIIDSEPHWFAAECEIAERFGQAWSAADARAVTGQALLVTGRALQVAGVPLTPEEIVHDLLKQVEAALRVSLPWRPGAAELLAELRLAELPCALVTMSWTSLVEVVLDQLPATFTAIVTGDQVQFPKPHPEPYLSAAAALGIPVRACLAIEDSPAGAASAQAAGMPVLAVPHVLPIAKAPGMVCQDSLRGIGLAQLVQIHSRVLGEI